MAELQEELIENGKLYMEGEVTLGADYSIFNAPVLIKKATKRGR